MVPCRVLLTLVVLIGTGCPATASIDVAIAVSQVAKAAAVAAAAASNAANAAISAVMEVTNMSSSAGNASAATLAATAAAHAANAAANAANAAANAANAAARIAELTVAVGIANATVEKSADDPSPLSTTNISAQSWTWVWDRADSPTCRDCSSPDTICSSDVGTFARTDFIPKDLDQSNSCISFKQNRSVLKRDSVLEFLGPNAVIAFVGDSNMRNLYLAAMEYFGNRKWYFDLETKSQNWTTADRKHRIDHTYLCPKAFGPTNLTLTFLWTPFIHRQTFFSKRVWSGCGGRAGQCPSSLGIPNCDQSSVEGAADRWECGDWIDEVQLPQAQTQAHTDLRKFVVLSHGGVHDALHSYKANTPHCHVNHTFDQIDKFYATLKTSLRQVLTKTANQTRDSYCWSAYGHRGAEIMISPLRFGRSKYVHDPTILGTLNSVLHRFIEAFHGQGLDEEFDGFVDAFELSSEERAAPFSIGDGIHYATVLYRAMLELVLQKVMLAEFR